jgi:hypothetical protein
MVIVIRPRLVIFSNLSAPVAESKSISDPAPISFAPQRMEVFPIELPAIAAPTTQPTSVKSHLSNIKKTLTFSTNMPPRIEETIESRKESGQ